MGQISPNQEQNQGSEQGQEDDQRQREQKQREEQQTQQQLAAQVGTQPSAISRIEDADYDSHSVDTLRRVAEALDMRLIIDFEPKKPVKRAKQI